MERNTILQLSTAVLKIFRFFMLASFLGLLAMLILYFTKPGLLDAVQIDFGQNQVGISLTSDETSPLAKKHALPQLTVAALLFNWLKFCAMLVLLTLLFQRALRIIQSLQNWKTFSQMNVHHFRSIGYYLLILAALASVNFLQFANSAGTLSFSLPLGWFAAALSAFVLAEIFKEGQQLAEEQKFTV